VLAVLPNWIQVRTPLLLPTLIYFVTPVASLAWLELSVGRVRSFVKGVIFISLVIGMIGIAHFVMTGSNDHWMLYSELLAALALAVLVIVVSVPRLSRRFLALPNRAVVVVGTLVFAIEGLHYNLSGTFHYHTTETTGSLAFAILLFSFGYVGIQSVLASEHRLLSIENELAIAREIHAWILPRSSPELKDLRVAAAYRPMAAVAGDFYEFIPVDQCRIGVLVADVTGHGVPAALIAAMIKVAMQSVVHCAHDPGRVLRGLNDVLFAELRAQLISASYLWLDTTHGRALYSAAGHPPMLLLREGELQRVESNGVPLGVLTEPEYPVCEMPIKSGDRFLLYTDGVIEPENVHGEAFGDTRLAEVVHANHALAPSEFVDQLLYEIREWQPPSRDQQDDITIVVIDLVP